MTPTLTLYIDRENFNLLSRDRQFQGVVEEPKWQFIQVQVPATQVRRDTSLSGFVLIVPPYSSW